MDNSQTETRRLESAPCCRLIPPPVDSEHEETLGFPSLFGGQTSHSEHGQPGYQSHPERGGN